MRVLAYALAALLPSVAYAQQQPAPYANAMPSQRPTIELPGVYRPEVPGPQGYVGSDIPRVCGNAALSSTDRARCESDMNRSASEAARADVRRKFETEIATPPPEIAPQRPSATSDTDVVLPRDPKADVVGKYPAAPEKSPINRP